MFSHQHSLWWYRGMAEINTRLLTRFAPKNKGNKILDAGCGTGGAFFYLKKFGHVIGVDVSENALRFAKTLGTVRKGDIVKLPFRDFTFDVVVCLDVLYHRWVGDYRQALSELYRVLKPGGIVVIREPAYNWMRGGHDKVDFTKRRFSKSEVMEELTRASFGLRKVTYANCILFPLVILRRLPQMVFPSNKLPTSDIQSVHPIIDRLLFSLLRIESRLIDGMSLPWGSSLICVAQK